jgi:uncharacterized protein (DUF58 family)
MSSLFAGNFRAAFSWRGVEFQDFRQYSYWDDARYIDWSASSREQSTIMRRYREEKQGNILCVVDVRESLSYQNNVKKWVYCEVLDLLHYASTRSGESFGWFVISGWQNNHVASTHSPVGLQKIKKLLETPLPDDQRLSLSCLTNRSIKRGVVFLLSDSLEIDEQSLRLSGLKHDIIFVHVSSHFENTLEWSGISRLKGQSVWYTINLDDTVKKQEYILKRKQKLSLFSQRLRSYWIDSIFLDENSSLLMEFLELMKKRNKS